MVGGMTHNLHLSLVYCYNWSGLNADWKGIAPSWRLCGVINPTPLHSLVLTGKYSKYDSRMSSIPSIIRGLEEVNKMLVAECRGVLWGILTVSGVQFLSGSSRCCRRRFLGQKDGSTNSLISSCKGQEFLILWHTSWHMQGANAVLTKSPPPDSTWCGRTWI